MTDPLSPEQLAELREFTQANPNGVIGCQGAAALIGEIDRLAAENEQLADLDDAATRRTELQAERDRAVNRWHVEHKRAETLEAENAELHRRMESIRLLLPTLRVMAGEHAIALVVRALDAHAGQDAPQAHAPGPWDGFADTEPTETPAEPQRPAEGVDLSGDLDDLNPAQITELKRISGPPAPADGRLYVNGPPCRHDHTWLVETETGWECMVCGPAKAEGIVPEDEGISTADVQAQQAADGESH